MAEEEDGSYVCTACGGLVRLSRRQAHESQWCPVLAAGSDDEDEADKDHVSMEVKALLSPQYNARMPVELSFAPRAPLVFSQDIAESPFSHERHADAATGGQLWWTELVLAELLVLQRRGPPGGERELGERPAALALGCGGSPVSAYVAAALGWEVLCTDLPQVLPLARKNFESEKQSFDTICLALAGESETQRVGAGGSVDFLPLPFGEELPEETSAWIESRGGVQLVLCSDCIWQSHRHRPLAVTLNRLLQRPGSEALVGYQMRQREELKFFGTIEHYNLRSEPLDATGAVGRAKFPPQFACKADAASAFFVHRVWRLPPAADEKS